jgi:two-component system response regulator AtoC
MAHESEKSQPASAAPALGSVLLVGGTDLDTPSLANSLTTDGWSVDIARDGQTASQLIKKNSYQIILLDADIPSLNAASFLEGIQNTTLSSTVILVTDRSKSASALEALRFGADDIALKPFSADDLVFILRKASERERLRRDNELLKAQVSKRYSFGNIIGHSQEMEEIFETVRKVCEYKTTVMIYGESGTGKELVARAIHYNSSRRNKSFVAVNCAAIPENLLESELFGHKRGAFTDATRDKKGLFEEAEGGTVLLDEVGELPLHLQVKLLRVLQENEIRPVGDNRSIPIDVRIIAATLRNLENDVLDGRFRDDLFYRLNVVALKIPPLRDRKEDIPILVNYFITNNREKLGLPVYGVSKDAMAALLEHSWPGNIRELENCIERAMILTEGESITLESLPKAVRASRGLAVVPTILDNNLSIKSHTRTLEENLIRRALEKTGGNRTHAAKLLEISHRTLLYKLKEFSLANDLAEESNPPTPEEIKDNP